MCAMLIDSSKAGEIAAYIAARPAPVRRALEALRRTIQSAAPQAVESISYGMPAFRLNGRPLVAFGAATGHCAFYPMSPATLEAHRSFLDDGYDTSKGTIRFPCDKPLPAALVRRLVKARIVELSGGVTTTARGRARRQTGAKKKKKATKKATALPVSSRKRPSQLSVPARPAGTRSSKDRARNRG